MTQNNNDNNISIKWFKNPKNIITALKKLEVKPNGKRVYLAAIFALLGYIDQEILDMYKKQDNGKKNISEDQLKMIVAQILVSLNQDK
jgi:hypothetical protein